MATYFDPTVDASKNLLPETYRTDTDLANVAALVEADVIGMFTDAPPYTNWTGRWALLRDGIVNTEVVGEDVTTVGAPSGAIVPQLRVYLRGYKVDADDANTDPNLKLALRRSIAEVLAWRIDQWNRESGVAATSDGQGKSRTYYKDVRHPFPPNWDRWLRPYVSREPVWGF